MEVQDGIPCPTLTTEEPGAAAKGAKGVTGNEDEAAGGGDRLGGKERAEDSGSSAKGDSEARGAGDSGSDAKGNGETGGGEDSGSDAKGNGETGGGEDSGSYAKGSHEAREEGDSGSDAKVSSEAEGTKTSGSDAKRDGEAGGEGETGSDVKGDGETGEAENAGVGAEEGKGTGTEEEAAVGTSGSKPQEGAAGAKPEKQGAEERGAGAKGASDAVDREQGGGSTSEEPLSPETGNEEQEWSQPVPSSPDEGLASPTGDAVFVEETGALQPGGASQSPEVPPDGSASMGQAAQQDQGQSPAAEGATPSKEKPKRPALDRREPTRPRLAPRAQSRKAIVEKFGGAASGPAPSIKKTGGANAIKNMLLEWCRAKTRGYEHVDIQNFSSSWSSGLAFCALIHKFFPDAFDYTALDPANRRENFTLAFATAEQHADCASLLEVEDMVRMSIPDSKCVYTYIQELYRSLVDKGLVKTKKK